MSPEYRNFLLAIATYAERRGLPTTTDLNIELINNGLSGDNIERVRGFLELYFFVTMAMEASEEELDAMEIDDDLLGMIQQTRELIIATEGDIVDAV